MSAPPPEPGRPLGRCKTLPESDHPKKLSCVNWKATGELSEEERLARETAQTILHTMDECEVAGARPGLDAVEQAEVIHDDQMDALVPILRSYASARLKVELEGLRNRTVLLSHSVLLLEGPPPLRQVPATMIETSPLLKFIDAAIEKGQG